MLVKIALIVTIKFYVYRTANQTLWSNEFPSSLTCYNIYVCYTIWKPSDIFDSLNSRSLKFVF